MSGTRVPVDVDDAWAVTLDMGGSRLATVEANFTAHGTRAAELELMGESGTIALSLLDVSAPIHVLDTHGTWSTIEVETGRPAGGPDHILGVEHLVDRIRGDLSPALSADSRDPRDRDPVRGRAVGHRRHRRRAGDRARSRLTHERKEET